MIQVEEAKAVLFNQVKTLGTIQIPIEKAFGHVLAQDILAPVDMPIFDASAVDGYALANDTTSSIETYELIGELKAGDQQTLELKQGQAIRLFTGAMVPTAATEVVMQEFITELDGQINFNEQYKPGSNIRKQGSQIKKNEIAMSQGTFLNPGTIGFLASMGIAYVEAYRQPAINIIVTGNEIVLPGTVLVPGQIFESNSYSLIAALNQMRIHPLQILKALDNRQHLDAQLQLALQDSDILLLTGGISVGKYDLVHDALLDAGAEALFYKVAQRPGKPMWAGKIGQKLIFALPGNPAAVMACFYEYVYPTIRMMLGNANPQMKTQLLPLLKEMRDSGERAAFIRAKIEKDGVMPLDKQDSGMMISFAGGNALIYVPKETQYLQKGELVEVHLLPFED